MSTGPAPPRDPLLVDVPAQIETPRLRLRCARPGDGAALLEAVAASLAELRPWMPWARPAPAAEDQERVARRMAARFASREDLVWLVFARSEDADEGPLLGGTGLHRMDWTVPRFEIGYWLRSGCHGHGLATEAVLAVARTAFDTLGAQRVEIRADARNLRSRRVAERAGFAFEGILRRDSLDVDGQPRDTCVYARVRGVEEP